MEHNEDEQPASDRASATRAAILDAAHELFVARGPDATSIRDIAEQAGVTKSLIHHHFGSKDALYDEICTRAFERYWREQMDLLQAERPTEGLLVDSMLAFFRFHEENPDFVLLSLHRITRLITEGPRTDREDELGLQLIEEGEKRLAEAREMGMIRQEVDPRWLLVVLLTATKSWFMVREEWRPLFPDLDDKAFNAKYFEEMMKLFLNGVRPPDMQG